MRIQVDGSTFFWWLSIDWFLAKWKRSWAACCPSSDRRFWCLLICPSFIWQFSWDGESHAFHIPDIRALWMDQVCFLKKRKKIFFTNFSARSSSLQKHWKCEMIIVWFVAILLNTKLDLVWIDGDFGRAARNQNKSLIKKEDRIVGIGVVKFNSSWISEQIRNTVDCNANSRINVLVGQIWFLSSH